MILKKHRHVISREVTCLFYDLIIELPAVHFREQRKVEVALVPVC